MAIRRFFFAIAVSSSALLGLTKMSMLGNFFSFGLVWSAFVASFLSVGWMHSLFLNTSATAFASAVFTSSRVIFVGVFVVVVVVVVVAVSVVVVVVVVVVFMVVVVVVVLVVVVRL